MHKKVVEKVCFILAPLCEWVWACTHTCAIFRSVSGQWLMPMVMLCECVEKAFGYKVSQLLIQHNGLSLLWVSVLDKVEWSQSPDVKFKHYRFLGTNQTHFYSYSHQWQWHSKQKIEKERKEKEYMKAKIYIEFTLAVFLNCSQWSVVYSCMWETEPISGNTLLWFVWVMCI